MSELIQRMPAVVQTIRLSDLVDIAILSIVIYKLLWMVRKTSSGRVLRGIMIVVVAIWASAEFNLYATSFVLNRVVEYAILVLVLFVIVAGFLARMQAPGYESWLLWHIFSAELVLILAPFTKLSHIVLYFMSRGQLGMDFAIKRGGATRGPAFPW